MRRAFVNSLYLGLFLSAGMMVMGLTFSGTILPVSYTHLAQNFWYFAKEHLDRAKKEKPKRVGFNSHQ